MAKSLNNAAAPVNNTPYVGVDEHDLRGELLKRARGMVDFDMRTNGSPFNAPYKIYLNGDMYIAYVRTHAAKNGDEGEYTQIIEVVRPAKVMGTENL